MFARVATFEGADEADIQRAVDGIKQESGPPEGVPSTGFLMLSDLDAGKVVAIGFFATREDLEKGNAVLNEISPPQGSLGRRTSVALMEVKFRADM
jgi:hypothetical protein